MKYLNAIKWYLAGIVLAMASFFTKGVAEGNASKAMMLIAESNVAFNSGEISQEEVTQAHEEAHVFAERTDGLRPISFWALIGSAACMLWSGYITEPISKFFRDVSIIVLIIATLMQFILI
ncbi:MAG: hypothetical protein AAGD11_04755 [Planctomycetota bacterium]